ncbi:response regulator [bacterium]|nr:response regulator [bacterium]
MPFPSMHFHSLRGRFLLSLLLIGIIPLLCFFIFDFYGEVHTINEAGRHKLIAVRDLKIREIDSWLDERTGDMQTYATLAPLVRSATLLLQGDGVASNDGEFEAVRDFLQEICDRYSAYKTGMVIDFEEGVIKLSSVRKMEGNVWQYFNHVPRHIDEREVVFTDAFPSASIGGQPSMYCVIPISTRPARRMMLVLQIDLSASLTSMIRNSTGLGETGETLIVNEDGVAVTALRHDAAAALRRRIDAVPASLARNAQSGVVQAKDYRGVEVIAAYSYLPRLGWGFVAKQDVEELHQPYYDRIGNIVLGFLTAILLGILVAYFLTRSTTEPLRELVRSAQQIAGGEYSVRVEKQRLDELGRLRNAFNEMAQSIETRVAVANKGTGIISTVSVVRNLPEFGEVLCKVLNREMNAMITALYLADRTTQKMSPFAATGSELAVLPQFDMQHPGGQLGEAMLRSNFSLLRLEQPDVLKFETIAGTAHPSELATLALGNDEDMLGALLIAKQRPFSETERQSLAMLQQELTSILQRVQAWEVREQLTSELQDKNQELESMAEELQQQSEELQYQNQMLEEQKRELEQANAMKSQFLSNISHELRTPLNAILSLSRVLEQRADSGMSEEEIKYISIVQRNAQELLSLINDLLDLARLESTHIESEISEFNISSLIGDISRNLETLAQDKSIAMHMEFPVEPVDVALDAKNVRLIVQNLLANAFKFTDAGEVRITVEDAGSEVKISVRDTGIGIAKDDLPHIFQEFRQVDGSTSRRYEGAGLGLSIASKAVKHMRGSIVVDSELGKGSCFTVTLPKKMRSRIKTAPRAELTPLIKPALVEERSKRILILEDNEAIVLQLRAVLEDEGFELLSLTHGVNAVEQVRSFNPDLLILDLMLPEIDGFSVLQMLRSAEQTQHLPVLVLTAKNLTREEKELLDSDAHLRLMLKGSVGEEELLAILYSMLKVN